MDVEYLGKAESLAIVRRVLAKAFPRTKFSVRLFGRAGNSRIMWSGDPSEAAVNAAVTVYSSIRFDGMIDFGYSVTHWLLQDNSAIIALDKGPIIYNGYLPRISNPRPNPDARLVCFGLLGFDLRRSPSPQDEN